MNPTSSIYDDPQLQAAKGSYETATRNASQAQAQGLTLPDMLKDALTKKFSTDNPQVQNRERLLGDYMNSVTQAPLDVTHTSAGGRSDVIFSPLEQANLIQGRRSASLSPLTTANYLLGLSQGGIGDVIESTGRAHQGMVAGLQGEAEIERGRYQDTLSELSSRAEQAFRQQQLEEESRQFDEKMGLERQQEARLGSGGGSGGSGGMDLSFLAELLGGGGGGGGGYGMPTEPQPQRILPRMHQQAEGRVSKGGEWMFSGGEWLPIVD